MTSSTIHLTLAEAEKLVTATLVAAGTRRENAQSVATALVSAEAEGQVGHGFSRLADYIAQVRSGKVDGYAIPGCSTDGEAALTIDACNGFAYPALDLAVRAGTAAAQRYGCASVAVTRSHHCGSLSVQVDKIARQGMIGLMVANAPAAIAPWGASVPVFGTNPIAFAAPRKTGEPLVIDLSLSKVARGKVMHAKKNGQSIPEGWAVDADGLPTTDPDAALAGSMLPMGGPKGTALALMVEILAAILPAANPSRSVASFFTADGPPSGSGQFLLVLKPSDPGAFMDRLEPTLTLISELDGARLPGERRTAAITSARQNGINVPKHYVDQLRETAGQIV
ncbi:Ldh family oxidoreductase [Shimia abyssi]|nr:Ldh family oxidoreductase [Shimia abyssi]